MCVARCVELCCIAIGSICVGVVLCCVALFWSSVELHLVVSVVRFCWYCIRLSRSCVVVAL